MASRFLGLFLAFLPVSFSVYSQDLIVTEYKGQTSFDRYEEFSEIFTIKNDGIVDITQTYYSHYVYLSPDPVLNNSDLLVGVTGGGALNAGQSQDLLFRSYTNACNVTPGTYYLIVKLDQYGAVTETDEGNNILLISNITINAPDVDWVFASLSVDIPVFHHHELIQPVSFNIQNTGTTDAGGYLFTGFYLSTDATLDAGDTYIEKMRSWIEGSNNVTDSHWWNDPVIPATIIPGQYYLIGKTDMNSDFDETDENNNIFVSNLITVEASDIDLFASGVSATSSGDMPDLRIDVRYEIGNHGSTGAAGYNIDIFLSFNNTFEEEQDIRLSDFGSSAPYIGPNSSDYGTSFLTYRDYIPYGAYYLVLVVNGNQTVTENNDTNNIIVSSDPDVIIMPPPVPAVAIKEASFTGAYDHTDTDLSLDITFENLRDPIKNYYIDYDLAIKDNAGNIVFADDYYQSFDLYWGQSVTYAWSINLSSPLPIGEYNLEITSTSSWNTTPLFQVPLYINVPTQAINGTIQGEDGTPITNGKLFLYQKGDDGVVRFINKTILTSDNHFTYDVDGHEHTLYFIPDRVTFPEYVPTIFGKTVTLKPSSFFTLAEDMNTVFEILKIQSLPPGPMSISGNVYSETNSSQDSFKSASMRIAQMTAESVEGFPVILLSSTGDPVSITTTDANGYYEFTNLPEAVYQIIVAFELDQPVMEEPVSVDVMEASAVVHFSISEGAIQPQTFYTQQILFKELTAKSYGDEAFPIAATVSSGLPVTLTSSNETVARIENGKIVILNAGTTTITASQLGNETYVAATPVARELVVNKAEQQIQFAALPIVTTEDEGFILTASATSALPVSFHSDNEEVAVLNQDNRVTITGAGIATITATQAGNENFNAAVPVDQQFRVNIVLSVEDNITGIKIYPNPVQRFLTIETTVPVKNIKITDTLGKSYSNISWSADAVDLGDLTEGIYFVKVQASNGYSVFKVIKR